MTLRVLDREEDVVWSKKLNGTKGFNQIRWDLITKRVNIPEAYFFRYLEYIESGEYEIIIQGEGVDLKGVLKVIDRQSPEY